MLRFSAPSMFVLSILALCACAPRTDAAVGEDGAQAADAAMDPAAVRQTIDSLNTKLEGWYAAGQIDSVVTVFAEDVWQMPPNNQPLVGRDAMHGFWTQAAAWGGWEFDFNVEDLVVADSIAVERGSYTMKFTAGPEAPMPSADDQGNYIVMWRLHPDGHWRIVWDAPVSTSPLPGMPETATPSASGR